MKAPFCPMCARISRLTTGSEVYPHRPDLRATHYYKCDGCGGSVGVHKGTLRPLGTPATAELRRARSLLHDELLDPLWKGGAVSRSIVYAYLAQHMGLSTKKMHVGMFNLVQCREAWKILKGKKAADIQAWKSNQTKGA
jgi:hypothetical protein